MTIMCKECNVECSAANALGYHLRSHQMTYEQYVIKHEHNGQQPTCKCGNPIGIKKGGFNKFCSRSCASSGDDNAMGRLKGEKSPNFGKKRTPEQLANYSVGAHKRWETHGDKLREMMETDEYKEAQSKAQIESYAANPNRIERIRDALGRFWSTSPLAPELRKRASDRAVKLLGENKIGPQAPYKQENKFNPFTQQEERMHSSWESVFLDTCIEDKYPVTKDHKITIPYVDESGIERQYIPDFYAFEDRTLYEIKGFATERDLLKWEAARQWCEQHGIQFAVLEEMT